MHDIKALASNCWAIVRRLSGDDAYERYLAGFFLEHSSHGNPAMPHAAHHPHVCGHHGTQESGLENPVPLSKQEYFKQWQDRKWTGIKRCC